MTTPADCEGCAAVRDDGGTTCGDCGTFLRLVVPSSARLVISSARERACGWTSRWERLACSGLDGGEHSQICDSLTRDFERDRDVVIGAMRKTVTINRGQAAEVLTAGMVALLDTIGEGRR